jgi:hypothetical protein
MKSHVAVIFMLNAIFGYGQPAAGAGDKKIKPPYTRDSFIPD